MIRTPPCAFRISGGSLEASWRWPWAPRSRALSSPGKCMRSPMIHWRWGWSAWPRPRPSSGSRFTPGTSRTSWIAAGSRWSRWRCCWLSAAALAAASGLLLRHGRPAGWIRWTIYAVIVVCGAARSFLLPARNALGADLVPRPLYPSAVAWRTGIWQVAAVSGPALGGILYAWVGPTVSYAIAAVLMAVALGAVARIRVAPRTQPARPEPLLASVRGGPGVPADEADLPGRDHPGPAGGAVRRGGRDPARSSPSRSCGSARRGWAPCAPRPPSAPW